MKTKKVEKKIEGEIWKKAIDKSYNKIKSKVKVDGFRKGKAPKDMIIKSYGIHSLLHDAANLIIDDAYEMVLNENKDIVSEMIDRPDITITDMTEEALTLEFEFTLKPDVKLGKYKGFDIKKEKAEVTKEEIEDVIKNLRERYAESMVKEDAIEEGDSAIIDFEGFVDGKPFDGGKAENYSLTIGSGAFIPGFEDQLIGLKAGDEKDVVVTFPDEYQEVSLQGKEATFKVKVEEVKQTIIPELDKDFFDDLDMEGVTNKEELEARISDDLLDHKDREFENKFIDKLLDEASKEVEVDIPEVMIKAEQDRIASQQDQYLRETQGMDLNLYLQLIGSNLEEFKAQMKPIAEKRVKERLMLEEIAKVEKLSFTEEEVKEEVEKLAEKYEMELDDFLKTFGGYEIVQYDLKMRKALEILKS